MKAINDLKNYLLKRREVKVIVESNGNLGFTNAIKTIGEQFKAKEDVIVINNVKGKFGRDTFLIDAFIYNSKQDKDRIEPRPRVKKAEGVVAK